MREYSPVSWAAAFLHRPLGSGKSIVAGHAAFRIPLMRPGGEDPTDHRRGPPHQRPKTRAFMPSAVDGGRGIEVLGQVDAEVDGIGPDPVDEARLASAGERESEHIHAGLCHHTTVMADGALVIE
jgi:hypothetical protein